MNTERELNSNEPVQSGEYNKTDVRQLQQRIFELEARNRVLELLAATDELTGLLNRRSFRARLSEELLRCVRYGRQLTLLYLDLDGFKAINDLFGHPKGDRVLKQAAETLIKVLRQTDIAARLGGDEFAVILPDTGLQGGLEAAERIRRAVAEISLEGNRITASIGAAEHSADLPTTAELLVLAADKQLYKAKALGGNNVCTSPDE